MGREEVTTLNPISPLRSIAFLTAMLALSLSVCCAQFEDSLQVPDSLGWPGEAAEGAPDTTLSWADSLGAMTRWVFPIGLMAVALAGVYALYSVRSR